MLIKEKSRKIYFKIKIFLDFSLGGILETAVPDLKDRAI